VSLSGLARAITARRAANLAGAGELTRRQQIHHIVRRLAFGATPAQLQHFRSIGAQATIQELLNYQNTPNDGVSDGSELELPFEPGPAAELRAWWVARMVDTAQPFEERMVLYWHGLLTSDIIKVGLPLLLKQQNDFFRANALAGWETLLKGIYKDPAMLRYLDNGQNQVGAPNENYAREQLELFTLGLGNYTEEDVRESARALTGWVIDRRDGQASFIPRRHDDGIKDFLGQSGRFNADDVVEIILQQPAAAHFITRRTMEHFVAPEPDGAYVERVKERFSADGMTIRTLVEAIFTDPDFLAPPNYWSTIKSPVEFVVGIARTFALPGELRGLAEAAALMGQALFVPPNVAGWPGGTSWISSGSWFYRLNFVNFVIDQIIASEVGRAMWADVDSAEGFVDLLIDTLLAGDVQPQQRDLIVQYASAPGAGKQLGPLSEERLRGALYLTLALPEYQLL
jgi:hypothetical protein